MPSPSPEQSDVRFVPDDPAHRLRIAVGSRVLIGMGSMLFWLLGVLGNRNLVHLAERMWARLVVWILRIRLDVQGDECIDRGQRYVIVSLHEGFADAVALLHLHLPMRFLVRDELFDWPALGRYLGATDQILVRETPDMSDLRPMYREISTSFEEGDNLVVFAQGSILGIEVAFRSGAFRIARSFGLPILPIVITGSHRVWEHPYDSTVRLDQRISMRVLSPIDPEELEGDGERNLERRMKEIALEPAMAPVRRFDPDRDGWWDGYRYEIDPDFPELARRVEARRAASV